MPDAPFPTPDLRPCEGPDQVTSSSHSIALHPKPPPQRLFHCTNVTTLYPQLTKTTPAIPHNTAGLKIETAIRSTRLPVTAAYPANHAVIAVTTHSSIAAG